MKYFVSRKALMIFFCLEQSFANDWTAQCVLFDSLKKFLIVSLKFFDIVSNYFLQPINKMYDLFLWLIDEIHNILSRPIDFVELKEKQFEKKKSWKIESHAYKRI